MNHFHLFTILFLCFALSSCNRQEEAVIHNCEKIMSNEEAQNIMESTRNNKFDSKFEIEQNLVGKWALIGLIPGWTGFKPIEECIHLEISTEEIIFKNLDTKEEFTTPWEVISYQINSNTGFSLVTNEDIWKSRTGMDIFSKNLMFGSGRTDDGDTYIYERQQ